jgi:hypothetical protein
MLQLLNASMVNTFTMPRFLFQPDPVDGYEFNPIPIDIHLGIIKIPIDEIIDDFGISTIETIIVGTDRKEVLDNLQKHFAIEFRRFDKLKESDSLLRKYEVKQAWTRIRKHIRKYSI